MILFNASFSKLNQLNQNQNKFIASTFVHLLRDIIVLSDIFIIKWNIQYRYLQKNIAKDIIIIHRSFKFCSHILLFRFSDSAYNFCQKGSYTCLFNYKHWHWVIIIVVISSRVLRLFPYNRSKPPEMLVS